MFRRIQRLVLLAFLPSLAHAQAANRVECGMREMSWARQRTRGPSHARQYRQSRDPRLVRGNDVCIQCHSQGRAVTNPILGRYYDWPVGNSAGQRPADYWQPEELKHGTTDFYQFADLTAHKNRMQGNDFVQSNMYHRQICCFDCHDVHSNENESNLRERGNALCLGCHTRRNAAGLKGTVSEHTHHGESRPGSQGTACHMPLIEQTIRGSYVAAHTFRFISPVETEQSGIPNPCTSCHAGKTNAWAIEALRRWEGASPWRVSN